MKAKELLIRVLLLLIGLTIAHLGIGTIICALLVGPVAGIFLPISEKPVKKVIERFE